MALALSTPAACGDAHDVGQARSLAALRSAEHSTDRAESVRVRSTLSYGKALSLSSDGALRWHDGVTGHLTIRYTGGALAAAMRKAGTPSLRARYLPDAYYARMSDTFAKRAGGRHWIRYGYADLARGGDGVGMYLKDQMRNTTPNQSVKMLLASGDVRRVGTERVQGARATHYRGRVRVADLAGRDSGLSARELAGLKRQLDQAGVRTETVDLWIDHRNLLVKKVERADTAQGSLVSTAYYRDYGVRIAAEAPPASDTRDFTELARSKGAAESR
ncbi:putative lipoprotein [Streptomyces griseoluteus]|nr:putative lipoprotein [Streptomyces griseoluteus]